MSDHILATVSALEHQPNQADRERDVQLNDLTVRVDALHVLLRTRNFGGILMDPVEQLQVLADDQFDLGRV